MTDTKEQKSISSIFLRSMLLVTVVSIVLIGCLWTWQQYQAFRQESKDLRNMMMASYKGVLKTQVKKSVEYIEYNKSLTKKKLKTSIRDRVMLAHTMATRLHEKWGGHKSREEIQATIKDSLGAMQVNRNPGYFFILDIDGVNQFKGGHPRFEGLDPGHVQDVETTAIVQSLISLAKGRQEGFHEYAWPKPGMDKGLFDKIAFVKFFEPYRWIIGTGEYLNDFESDVKTETLNYLETCRFGKDGYIFVTQWDGLDLIGPARGKNMLGARDVNGVKIVQEFISLAKSGGGVP